jgi:predicted HicB family RNase H-like nuclease
MPKELKTIKVQKDTWQTAKIEATKQNITLEEYVTNALAAYLKKEQNKQ